MRTAALTTPFLVQSMRVVPDGHGGSVQQWNTVAALWGSLTPYKETDTLLDVREATHIVHARYRSDLTIGTSHRLTYNGDTYQVRKVVPAEGRKRFIKLIVSQVTYLN